MEINIDRLISLKLSLEGYFILWCLYNEEGDKLTSYCNSSVYKIPSKVFEQLVNEKYIEFSGEKSYTLTNMTLTDRFKTDVLGLKDLQTTSFDVAFQQLRECYPTKTPNGRRLHQDIDRCKRIYKNTVCTLGNSVNQELHSLILQCINFTVNQKTKDKSLEYLQMLPTYLAQKNWETVKEDVEEVMKKTGFVEKKSSNNGGFMEDV